MSTPDYFADAEDGIDLDGPPENGEIALFELDTDSARVELVAWADAIMPGVDGVALSARTRVGDLVLHRPGSNAFEVYTRSENTNFERVQARLRILEAAGRLDAAKSWDAWVHGDVQ